MPLWRQNILIVLLMHIWRHCKIFMFKTERSPWAGDPPPKCAAAVWGCVWLKGLFPQGLELVSKPQLFY